MNIKRAKIPHRFSSHQQHRPATEPPAQDTSVFSLFSQPNTCCSCHEKISESILLKMHSSILAYAALLVAPILAIPTPDPSTEALQLPPGVTEHAPDANAAVGNAIVRNNCGFSIQLSSVGGSPGPVTTIPSGGSYSEQLHVSSTGAGISIKVDQNGSPLTSNNIAQFEYTLSGSTVYYDLSLINGDPFKAQYQAINPSIGSCDSITCQPNEVPCQAAYTQPNQQKTHACASSGNLVFNICH